MYVNKKLIKLSAVIIFTFLYSQSTIPIHANEEMKQIEIELDMENNNTITTEEVSVPYSIRYEDSNELPPGREVVIVHGKEGLKEIVYQEGVEISHTFLSFPQEQVIARGVSEPTNYDEEMYQKPEPLVVSDNKKAEQIRIPYTTRVEYTNRLEPGKTITIVKGRDQIDEIVYEGGIELSKTTTQTMIEEVVVTGVTQLAESKEEEELKEEVESKKNITEIIPFTTRREYSPQLKPGQEIVIVKGRNGIDELIFDNGNEVSRIHKQLMVQEVVVYGKPLNELAPEGKEIFGDNEEFEENIKEKQLEENVKEKLELEKTNKTSTPEPFNQYVITNHEKTLPYETYYQIDPELKKDEERIIQKGLDTIIVEKRINGLILREQKTIQKGQTEIVAVGVGDVTNYHNDYKDLLQEGVDLSEYHPVLEPINILPDFDFSNIKIEDFQSFVEEWDTANPIKFHPFYNMIQYSHENNYWGAHSLVKKDEETLPFVPINIETFGNIKPHVALAMDYINNLMGYNVIRKDISDLGYIGRDIYQFHYYARMWGARREQGDVPNYYKNNNPKLYLDYNSVALKDWTPKNNQQSTYQIMIHELIHALGVEHNDFEEDRGSIMTTQYRNSDNLIAHRDLITMLLTAKLINNDDIQYFKDRQKLIHISNQLREGDSVEWINIKNNITKEMTPYQKMRIKKLNQNIRPHWKLYLN